MWYIYSSFHLYRTAPLNPCSTYTALVVFTGRHHLIHVVHILLLSFVQDAPFNPCSTYTALVVCTGRHHLIHVVLIQLLSFVQDGTIESMWYIYSSCHLYRTAPLNPCSTYTALVACTGRHHLIHVVLIQLLSFVQDGTIESM